MQQENITQTDIEEKEPSYTFNIDGNEREYSIEEIKDLMQKGFNYQLVSDDYQRVLNMAQAEGSSVGEYLSRLEEKRIAERREELLNKCGDSELAEYVLNLEAAASANKDADFDELREYFPQIKDKSELPLEVTCAAKLKGTRLLDEWLRYRQRKQSELSAVRSKQKSGQESSIGSQREHITADYDPAKLQFIKGVWGK